MTHLRSLVAFLGSAVTCIEFTRKLNFVFPARLGMEYAYRKKGDLRPARAGAKRNPFCFTVACRSVLAGRPGQRRCRPVVVVSLELRMLRGVAL
jgi:hypothetical protein